MTLHITKQGNETIFFQFFEEHLFNGQFSEAEALNTDFEAEEDNHCENSYKEFYRIYVAFQEARDGDTELSPEDSSALMNLALMCPGSYGPAIYQARALYSHIYCYYEFGDCQGGDAALRKRESPKAVFQGKTHWDLELFPNPAADLVTIRSNAEKETLHVRIFDVSGRRVRDVNVYIVQYESELQLGLKEGIYFLDFTNESNETCNRKLVISN